MFECSTSSFNVNRFSTTSSFFHTAPVTFSEMSSSSWPDSLYSSFGYMSTHPCTASSDSKFHHANLQWPKESAITSSKGWQEWRMRHYTWKSFYLRCHTGSMWPSIVLQKDTNTEQSTTFIWWLVWDNSWGDHNRKSSDGLSHSSWGHNKRHSWLLSLEMSCSLNGLLWPQKSVKITFSGQA
jgi:hypothetical protein